MKKEYSVIMENTRTIFFKETDKFAEKPNKKPDGEDGEKKEGAEEKEEGEEKEPKKES